MFKPILIDIENLYYEIARHCIISGFSMRLARGKIAVLLGPSGCGKSTILRIIAGLIKGSASRFYKMNVATSFVFQEPNLLPFYTVEQNLALVGEFQSGNSELLRLLRLDETDATKYPDELSGGMKTRVNLARALLNEPALMLLDEPFTGINYELKEFLLGFLRALAKRENKGILMVTHDRLEALKIADIIYILGKNSRVLDTLVLNESARGEAFFAKYKDFLKVHYG